MDAGCLYRGLSLYAGRLLSSLCTPDVFCLQLSMVELLVEHGADLDATTRIGETPHGQSFCSLLRAVSCLLLYAVWAPAGINFS